MPTLVCALAGLLAGFAGGLFGISGGVVIVPTLVLALRYSQHRAQGTSLAALALPVAALGAYGYWSQGQSSLELGALLALGFAIGHVLGSRIAHALSGPTMVRTFAAFLACLALYLFSKGAVLNAGAPQPFVLGPVSGLTVLAIATFAGTLGGLFGFGGGIVSVPILVMVFGLSQHVAQGSALLALTLPVTAVSAWKYHREGNVDRRASLCLAIGVFLGGALGSALALSLTQTVMQRAFACFLTAIALYLFLRRPGAKTP